MTKKVGDTDQRGVPESETRNRCRWCRRVVTPLTGPGRPRVFCSQACRQWDWVSRQRARELQISENELVVTRRELERLYDDLYVLTCAIEDTERELGAGRHTVASLREAVNWLLDAARPLKNRTVSPSGI
jgi:hypothetical protein